MSDTLDTYLAAYGDDFPYAFDNAIILNWYPQQIIAQTSPAASVLELGVGHGLTCHRFGRHFDHYEVVDGSRAVLDAFHKNYPDSSAISHQAYFEKFNPGRLYDLIVMGFVLEHVDDPALILRRYRGFLSKGGRIVVAVPNAESLHRRFGNAAGVLEDMMELGDGDKALGHLRLFTTASLTTLLEETGYRVTSRNGIFLKPFTTAQLKTLDLSADIINAMCEVGCGYPELSAALLFQAEAA